MIDFALVPDRSPIRECQLVGRMPVRTNQRLVGEVSLGCACPALLGVLARVAQVAHRQVLAQQWDYFAKDGRCGATREPRKTMTTASGGSREMLRLTNMQASQHGRAPGDTW